ncbi:hypothetical protein ACFLZX_03825 [Nanoarchaeota archaeon]
MIKCCPKCGSENVKFSVYDGAPIVTCSDCGYDESSDLEVYPEERSTQREKSKHSPYKKGGHKRTTAQR